MTAPASVTVRIRWTSPPERWIAIVACRLQRVGWPYPPPDASRERACRRVDDAVAADPIRDLRFKDEAQLRFGIVYFFLLHLRAALPERRYQNIRALRVLATGNLADVAAIQLDNARAEILGAAPLE